MKNLKGTLILLLTALIWGTAFVAQTSAADDISPFAFLFSRSLLASIFLFLLVLFQNRARLSARKSKATDRGEHTKEEHTKECEKIWNKSVILAGIFCGIPLAIASILQQIGIGMYPKDTAASGRAGFLTATYVIMVSLYSIIKARKLRISILVATVVCMVGMYLLSLSEGFSKIYTGDILIFLCAIGYAVYILVVDKYGTVDTTKVSCIQFCFVTVFSLIGMLIFENPSISDFQTAAIPICYAGIFSSGIAYTLQMVGQKYAEPAVATIVMSLESVFAALSGWLILNEQLKGRELLGCVLVFVAVILAQLPDISKSSEAL